MKVSIIIPAHNEEKNVAAAIKAALLQTYADKEVIVVDNASTDNTNAIARSYSGITVVKEERKGLLYARECGRMAAHGDIIAQMDADCLPDPDWVSKAVKYFADPRVVIVGGSYDYYDGDSFFRIVTRYAQRYLYSTLHFLTHRIFKKGAVAIGGNIFLRASVLRDIGGYDTTIHFYGEDTNLAKRMSKAGKAIFDPRITMKTSARRFKNLGSLKVIWLYLINFIWVTAFKKPYTVN